MLKNKIGKMLMASVMAATMITTTATTIVPMTVSAGQCLGQQNFDEGMGLPWHTCETQPAKQTFNIDNGSYNVTIVNPGGAANGGESRWDLQFRHRGLKIVAGHTYKIHWEVTASNSGDLATHIASLDGESQVVWHNNANDFGQGWSNVQIQKGKNSFDSTFTASESIEVAEWAFHYGGAGEWQDHDCFPVGTTLSFDNMSLECTNANCTDCDFNLTKKDMGVIEPENNIRINQVGYFTNLTKKATLGYNDNGAVPASYDSEKNKEALADFQKEKEFQILDSSKNVVYTGTSEYIGEDEDSSDYLQILDFSDFNTPGSGYTIKCGDYTSYEFAIADTVYDGMLKDAMNYYYQNRSGIDIESKYITSGDTAKLAHVKGHDPDNAYVQSEWKKAYSGVFDGDKSYSIDGTGGWYDAGDHGKYVVNGGVSVWTLQNIYERAVAAGQGDKWADGSGTIAVPEASNGAPDILDETRVELEWFFKMIVSSKDPVWGKYEGLVYHKLHDHKWTGLAIRPNDYEATWGTTRIVKPPSFAATLNLAATAAQAARLWKGIDDTFANECLANAKKCYDAAKEYFYEYTEAEATNPKSLYAPLDQAIGGGAYGDTNVKDDMYWAACELYAATGDTSYYTDVKSYGDAFKVVTNLEGGENNGSFSSFNWGNTASLGTLSLYLNEDKITASEKSTVDASITAAADVYLAKEDEQGYGIPYQSTTFQDGVNIGAGIDVYGYEWGSNSFVVNNAIVMAYAYDQTADSKYINGVSTAMDYILGRNPLDFSYVTGYGTSHLQNPHHRYWSYMLDKSNFPMAPAGVMSGGPGSGMQDPYVGGLGYKRGERAPQLCYVDSVEAWSVNEVTINWNAPFAWVVSFLEDEAKDVVQSDFTIDKKEITLAVGETDTITPSVSGCTFESSDSSIAKVDDKGVVTGVAEGTATITVTSPDGDKLTCKVTVTDDTLGTTKYGDVDCNGTVDIVDVVLLNKHLLNKESYPITAQGKLNADCVLDSVIAANDSGAIQQYLAQLIPYENLGK